MYECDDKMVSHPSHYQGKNGLKAIDVIEAFTADLSGIEATDTGNILKYACRWKQKNGVQDLKKIMWYTQHLIEHLEGKDKKEESMTDEDVSVSLTVDDIVFDTWRDANEFMDCMQCQRNIHGKITVGEVYAYCGIPRADLIKSYMYGWTSLNGWELSSTIIGRVTLKMTPATKLK